MYGTQAIHTLTPLMEEHRENLVVIIAGYADKIDEMLKTANPGFSGRFKTFYTFEDYTPQELLEILERSCLKEHYTLRPEAREKALRLLTAMYERRDETFSNARLVRNLFEKATGNLKQRIATLSHHTKETVTTIELNDIPEMDELLTKKASGLKAP